MKKESLERGLLEYGSAVKRGKAALASGTGKIIAAIAAIIAVLLTFMDVKFFGISAAEFSTTLVILLISGYVIYFSLERAGEDLGESNTCYKECAEKYDRVRKTITPEMIPELREFCREYSTSELDYRRQSLLCASGLSADELSRFKRGEKFERTARRALRRATRLKVFEITPQSLISSTEQKSELYNPEPKKLFRMSLGLLPSTLCMLLTASVILTSKDGMTVSDFIDGAVKLATLPILGFRGYEAGYSYATGAKQGWLETKTRLLECFLEKRHRDTAN